MNKEDEIRIKVMDAINEWDASAYTIDELISQLRSLLTEPCTPVYDVGSPVEYIKMRWGQDA